MNKYLVITEDGKGRTQEHRVTADFLEINGSGDLCLYEGEPGNILDRRLTLAYANGHWTYFEHRGAFTS